MGSVIPPVADFPVRRVIGAHHYIADLTLPYGRVAFDYNKEVDAVAQQAAE
jgi:acetoacetate decarboxylase